MKRKDSLLAATGIIACGVLLPTCAAEPEVAAPPPVVEQITTKVAFQLGDTTVRTQVFQRGEARPTMFNLHDDENTSVQAGLVNVEQYGGRLIELTHTGLRHVTFRLNGERYSFDPNRIFSDAGIAATLKRQSTYNEDAHAAVRAFARQLLDHFALEKEPVIIALHNTVDGTFSARSFTDGGNSAEEAAAVHLNPERSPFNFMYVTDKRFFDFLKERGFNVVLQDNDNVTDDGSLSVYFARKGIPYINIEARLGSLSEQVEMLKAVREMLRETGLEPR